MAKYRVTLRQDAWIYHTAEIEASSPEHACDIAELAWLHGGVEFHKEGCEGFDAAECDPEDCQLVEETAP